MSNTYQDAFDRTVCVAHDKVCLSHADAEYKARAIREGMARTSYGVPNPFIQAYHAPDCDAWHLGNKGPLLEVRKIREKQWAERRYVETENGIA